MEEGAQTTDTEETLGGVGAIVLPTEPPPQPATSSSNDAAGTHPSRLFTPSSPQSSCARGRSGGVRNRNALPSPAIPPVCDAPPHLRVYIASQRILFAPWPSAHSRPGKRQVLLQVDCMGLPPAPHPAAKPGQHLARCRHRHDPVRATRLSKANSGNLGHQHPREILDALCRDQQGQRVRHHFHPHRQRAQPFSVRLDK